MRDRISLADRLGWWRAWIAFFLGLFMLTQGGRVVNMWIMHPEMHATVLGWPAWSVILLFFVLFGSGLWRGPKMRALLNDEGSRANRHSALMTGFWAMLLAIIGCYVATDYVAIDARAALHIVLAAGVGTALLRFSGLERRALKA